MSLDISKLQCPPSSMKLSREHTASTIVFQEQHTTRDCQSSSQLGRRERIAPEFAFVRILTDQHASHPQIHVFSLRIPFEVSWIITTPGEGSLYQQTLVAAKSPAVHPPSWIHV
ncbi:hypothetical protein GJ744_008622 [Endocarpon pusillum]|uniref:Uncharacterized protein n=1 Tax=Endocarpon pusillum TaxID=364733 RepID=A0A8H7AH38_9EURO|nr:hypothetical protein GJ744_008622 [Endocarpon pusillum]